MSLLIAATLTAVCYVSMASNVKQTLSDGCHSDDDLGLDCCAATLWCDYSGLIPRDRGDCSCAEGCTAGRDTTTGISVSDCAGTLLSDKEKRDNPVPGDPLPDTAIPDAPLPDTSLPDDPLADSAVPESNSPDDDFPEDYNEAILRHVFNDIDTDGDNYLSEGELIEAELDFGQGMSNAEIHDLLFEMDKDGDGYLDFDEYLITPHI
ncbi:uncharacterized protein LOC106164130 [Lingula anatina]|uniref:Uncharacterized protein LOC106164130 n=1 Tax=Lingula anatina TaxID=7574 RepID=A0A1S3IHN6_LINAN|nr:uncharacterized protein LOC106164130 [Lingula anatina]|eukprot:XP_013397386.1 uncharacterized protein LOC106164130 [Lingula anatina]